MQVALGVQDLPRASQFYTILLGSPPAASFDPPGLVFFDLDGVRLLLDRNAPASLIYLQVEDLTGTLEHLREHAQILSPPHRIFIHENDTLGPAGREEWQAFITDTEGNTIGLITFHERPV